LLLLYHPEIIQAYTAINNNFVINYSNYVVEYSMNLLMKENMIRPTLTLIQLSFIIFIIFLGVLLYFTFFTSPTKEENLVDNDFMIAGITIEAEEEIASMDDTIIAFGVVLYVFG